jgi:hypothetical protein
MEMTSGFYLFLLERARLKKFTDWYKTMVMGEAAHEKRTKTPTTFCHGEGKPTG